MGAPQFYSGDMAHVMATVGGTTIELPARSWKLTIDGKIKDVSNARDGRYRIGGLVDASGSVDMPYDGAIYIPRVKDIITLKLYPNYNGGTGSYFFGLTGIVTTFDPAAQLEGEIVIPINFMLQSGVVTYPTYP